MSRFDRSYRLAMWAGASALAMTAAAGAAWAADEPSASTPETVKEVVVTGQRKAIQSAQEIKKNKEQIVDSITATDIGALPDRSVTEALQRIVGVTITRTPDPRDADRISVEGAGVQIRGISYVRSELNGRDSFSAKNGRALSFDDIPPELMAGVDVYKNPSADMIEGQLGGTVDLRTRLPFDQPGRILAFSADANYGDKIGKWTPSGSVLLSDRWRTPVGELGLLVDFSDSNLSSRTDTISVDQYYTRAVHQADASSDATYIAGAPNNLKYVYVPGGFGYRRLDFNRERQGLALAGQWRPSSELLVTAQFLRSAAYSSENEHAVGVDPGNGLQPAAGQTFKYNSAGYFTSGVFSNSLDGSGNGNGTTAPIDLIDERYNTTHSVTSDYSLGVKWQATAKLNISADIQYINSSTKTLDFTLFDLPYTLPTSPAVMKLNGGGVPYLNIPVNAADAKNLTNYWWDAAMDYHDRNHGDEWAERADATYTFDGDWLKTFRFGVRHAKQTEQTLETNYNWGEVTYNWAGGGVALLDGTNVLPWGGPVQPGVPNNIPAAMMPFGGWFRGGANLPGIFPAAPAGFLSGNWNQVSQIIRQAENNAGLGSDGSNCCGWTPFNGNYAGGFPATIAGQTQPINNQSMETWAGYGLLRFGHDLSIFGDTVPMDGNIGVRVVDTKSIGAGQGVYTSPGQGCSTNPTVYPTAVCQFLNGADFNNSANTEGINVLPSLNLRLKVTPEFQIRFAAAKDMARPSFAQMQPAIIIGGNGGYNNGSGTCGSPQPPNPNNCVIDYTAYSGNAKLKPVRGDAYDLSFEWYFAKAGSFTTAVFYKDVYDFVSTATLPESFTNNGQTNTVLVTTPYNAGHGTIKGFEVAYQQYYDFLPGLLKGFGLQGNFTYIDSRGAVNASQNPFDPGQIGAAKLNLPLEGLSRSAYNVAALYDRGPVSLRLAYNWRDKYLLTTDAANVNLPAWAAAYGQLDASGFYTINSHLKIGVQAANLTASVYKVLLSYDPLSGGVPIPGGTTGHNWVDSDRRVSIVLRGTF